MHSPLWTTFSSPLYEQSTIMKEYSIPPCYQVQAAPTPFGKIASFADETLFYIFYVLVQDELQLAAATEL